MMMLFAPIKTSVAVAAGVKVKHKAPVKVNDKASMQFVDDMLLSCDDEKTIGSSTNQRHQHDAALLPIVNMDTHIRTSSPQPIALSDGGEIVQLESKEQKSLVDFDATTNQAYQSSVLGSSKMKNMIEAIKGWWNSPIQRTEKDMREVLNEECLTKCALSLDDSTEQNSVDPIQGRSPLHSMEHEQQAMFEELGMDPENEGIVSDLLRNRSLIAIKDFDHWVGMLPNLKNELTLSGLLEIIHGLLSSCGDERIIILTSNHNHIDRVDAALLHPLNIDLYIHTSSPQPIAVPDGGEIVQLDSSERKSLEGFDATNNRAYKSDVHMSNSEEKSTREASRRQCMPEQVLSLVDSMTRISSTDSDAPNNSTHLVRAYQSGPIVFNSEKKDSGEGLNRECLTKSVLSLDDSSRQKSLPDVDATTNKAHLLRAYQKGLIVSLSENKNRGEALKRECITKSMLGLEDLQQHFGGRSNDAAKNFPAIYDPDIHRTDSLAGKSFKVVETLPSREQPNDCVPLLSIGRLTLEGWLQEEKSPNLPRVLQINVVEQQQEVTKIPICLEGLTAEFASSSLWLIGLPDGRHIVVLDPLEQSTKNVAHAARVDQCSPTVSLLEKKMLRKTLKRKCRTMSVVFKIHQQHFGRKCEGSAKSFHATCIGKKHGTNQVSTVKRIHKQHRIHQWPFRHKWATRKRYSAGDKRSFQVSPVSMNEKLDSWLQFIHMSQRAKADESGPTVSNSEKGSLREALKCDSLTNTRSLNDLREHFGARRKDAAKGLCGSLALKSFEVLDSLPLGEQSYSIRNVARRRTLTHKHCVRLKKSQDLQQSLLSDCSGELAAQAALGLPDGGHVPSLPEKKIVRKTLKRKFRTMSVLSLEDHQQHVSRRWEDDAKFLGAKRICRQLAIDRKPTEKRILRQHGTRRCQSKQSAIDLPDGGHILSLSKKKIVRKTLKRKCRNMSVLGSEYHQLVDSKWDDAMKSLGAKHIYRQLVIHRVSRAKRIRRQHGFHRWPFQQNWATLKGYFLRDERPVAVISLSIDGKLVSRLQLIHISWFGRFSPRPPALPPGGEIVGPPLALSSSQLPSTSNRAQLGGQDRSGATASHSQNERTRDQPEGRKRKIKHFTIEDLRQLCRLNREDAAKELGVSVSTLKRRRQELGIMRWPPPEEVFRPPDGNGENNPPSTSNMLSANGQITMEIGMGGPNSEPNERLPNSFEDPNFQNMGNGSIAEFENPTTFYDSHHGHDRDADFLFPDVFNGTEAAGGSGYLWEQRFESSDPMFLVYSDAAAPSQSALTIPPTMPPPQIASTQIPRENMGEDRRSFLTPQEEPLPEGHVFVSVNCTIGSISDLAPSQDMPTAADTMESSEYLRDPLASVVGHRMENNHYGSSNLIDASCSNLALSQTMQPTISHMTPLLTERQDSRFVKLDATCDEDLINLYLPLMPGIMELKQAVSVQLGLGLDRFKVKYKDGRGKWILMTHDEDVRELRRLTSSENQDSNRLEVIKGKKIGIAGKEFDGRTSVPQAEMVEPKSILG
ncbi:hypothetical protein Vadar_010639 [Vaccinium darrowii]|uniref:Uncharacterized protein n=1 Tax=Vaccinium darrowii TaxID=229202 RepID=A0ACB7YDY8_9ERIC|nr:hypothetical protein Vadar_010639 [Vaccinium darrowii]